MIPHRARLRYSSSSSSASSSATSCSFLKRSYSVTSSSASTNPLLSCCTSALDSLSLRLSDSQTLCLSVCLSRSLSRSLPVSVSVSHSLLRAHTRESNRTDGDTVARGCACVCADLIDGGAKELNVGKGQPCARLCVRYSYKRREIRRALKHTLNAKCLGPFVELYQRH